MDALTKDARVGFADKIQDAFWLIEEVHSDLSDAVQSLSDGLGKRKARLFLDMIEEIMGDLDLAAMMFRPKKDAA